jgi:hypothetical protein
MNLLPWNGIDPLSRRGSRRDAGGRAIVKLKPTCECLDGRQLLSTVAAAKAVLPVPSANAVANATATLNAVSPTAFAKFQSDLVDAEGQSRVTSADGRTLVRDEKIIDLTIESGGLDSSTTSTVVNQVQTDVDNAFLETTLPASSWAQEQQELSQLLAQADPSQHFSSFFIRDVVDQMKVVARAARDTSQFNGAVTGDWAALTNDLGPTPDTNLGSGTAGLDALQIYYNGQVNKFIK